MINSAIALIARLTIGKHIVAGIAKAHNALDGRRSEIAIGLIAIVHGLKLAGIIPADTADGIEKALAAILPLTLADKVSKAQALIAKVIPAPAVEPKPDAPN